jgi:hypothetical protein
MTALCPPVQSERSTDIFELRDDVMLWTKSTDTVEKLAIAAPRKNDARVSG